MFMYQYRKETERIIQNLSKDKAYSHILSLYNTGLINLPQWDNLRDYIKLNKEGV